MEKRKKFLTRNKEEMIKEKLRNKIITLTVREKQLNTTRDEKGKHSRKTEESFKETKNKLRHCQENKSKTTEKCGQTTLDI